MTRATFAFLLGTLTACTPAPPCDETSCAEWCESHQGTRADETTSPLLLTLEESKLVSDRLESLRRGVRPIGERGLTLCRGKTRCEEPVPENTDQPLPPGDYVLHAELTVPQEGTWTGNLWLDCQVRDENSREENQTPIETKIPLKMTGNRQGRPWIVEAAVRLHSPFDGPATNCTVIFMSDHSHIKHIYRFVLPGTS